MSVYLSGFDVCMSQQLLNSAVGAVLVVKGVSDAIKQFLITHNFPLGEC